MSGKRMTCIGCNKRPNELMEYIELAAEEHMSPEEYVIREEGTYNGFEKERFYCTPCYIAAGMPLNTLKPNGG